MNIINKLLIITIIVFLGIIALAANTYSAEITRDTNVITINGTIDDGDGEKFKNVFDLSVNHIRLESTGGYVHEGLIIADILAENPSISTEAIGTCTSMCAVIWMATDRHVYNSDGKIGFHLQYVNDREYVKYIKDEYGWSGVEWNFKDEVMSFLSDIVGYIDNTSAIPMFIQGLATEGLLGHNMWYPTYDELIQLEGKFTPKPRKSLPLLETINLIPLFTHIEVPLNSQFRDIGLIAYENNGVLTVRISNVNIPAHNLSLYIVVNNKYTIYTKEIGYMAANTLKVTTILEKDLVDYVDEMGWTGILNDMEINSLEVYLTNNTFWLNKTIIE